MTIQLSTSVRERATTETLALAKEMAARAGITRVAEVTRLDRVGVPIFVSIRPDGKSLCVNSGKSLDPLEAEVGAYMEAIEFFYAESSGAFDLRLIAPGDLAHRLSDFGLLFGAETTFATPILCVQFESLQSGRPTWIPAELAFHPFREMGYGRLFGTSTNGLSSGNSIEEATVHGLLELIERDCFSFYQVRDDSLNVSLESLPANIRSVMDAARTEGLETIVKFVSNEFDLPFFVTLVHERSQITPLYTAVGCGLHLQRDIALTRSVTEAFQSRLAYIHGGRDDIVSRFESYKALSLEERISIAEQQYQSSISRRWIEFESVPTRSPAHSVKDLLANVMTEFRNRSFEHVYRLVLTQSDASLAVVRVVAPCLENYSRDLPRIGERLKEYYVSVYS